MIMFIYLPLTLFLFHPTSKHSEPGYIEHLFTLNTFSFPVNVQCRQFHCADSPVKNVFIVLLQLFSGNMNKVQNHANIFIPPLLAKYVRVQPYVGLTVVYAMRMELYGCPNYGRYLNGIPYI